MSLSVYTRKDTIFFVVVAAVASKTNFNLVRSCEYNLGNTTPKGTYDSWCKLDIRMKLEDVLFLIYDLWLLVFF